MSPRKAYIENDEDVDVSVISVQSSMSMMGSGFPAFAGASGRGRLETEDQFSAKRMQANSAHFPNRSPLPFRQSMENSIIMEGAL